jgi:hypothetical protein
MIRETFYEDTFEEFKKLLNNYIVERDASIFRIYRLFFESESKKVRLKVATIIVTWSDNKPNFELVPTEATSVRDHQNIYRAFKGEENLPLLP